MRYTQLPPSTTAARGNTRSNRHIMLAALLLIAGFALLPRAHASDGLCSNGSRCAPLAATTERTPEHTLLDFGAALQASMAGARRDELSSQEYFSFSGVGAIVCTVNGKRRMSTAFLVGAFDIGVTVAHTFDNNGAAVPADDCFYTSTDSLGQIRERISISYVRSQWAAEAGAAGHTSKDFAVVRLSEPSHYAQRTMPMGKFSGNAVSVLMIGFRDDMESDPLKSKSRGTVYERRIDSRSLAALEGFTHDIDARGIADGSPVIDENTGVIIGIHTAHVQASDGFTMMRNTMITMNDWLEQTLRAEMQLHDEKGANSAL